MCSRAARAEPRGSLPRSSTLRGVAVLIAALLMLALAGWAARPDPAQAATWVVKGGGFGHGVGMSAYGAYGFGKKGANFKKILNYYYAGIKVERKKRAPEVRVLLGISGGPVDFRGATRACGSKLKASKRYRARRSGNSVRLTAGTGKTIARCGKKLHAEGKKDRLRIGGYGTYRGALEIVPTESASGSLNVVNKVGVNDYVRGSLPAEVFPDWPDSTLKAFAIAIRSIALSTDVDGNGFDIYSDTRTQVYEGVKAEAKKTNDAARSTLNKVATYKGKTIQATYFSASGGRTESRFLGGPKVPYYKSVKDPYDNLSPLHRWKFRFSQGEMNGRLSGLVSGRLKRIEVLQRGDSPRVDYARIVAGGGSTKVRGDSIAVALGLYDRWMNFDKLKGRAAHRADRTIPSVTEAPGAAGILAANVNAGTTSWITPASIMSEAAPPVP